MATTNGILTLPQNFFLLCLERIYLPPIQYPFGLFLYLTLCHLSAGDACDRTHCTFRLHVHKVTQVVLFKPRHSNLSELILFFLLRDERMSRQIISNALANLE